MLTPQHLIKAKNKIPDLGRLSFQKERIIDELCRIKVEVVEDDEIETAYIYDDRRGGKVAIYNPRATITIQTISLAHEFAHIVLDHHKDPAGNHPKQEAEATNLAFSLIIPRFVSIIDRINSCSLHTSTAYQIFKGHGATDDQALAAATKADAWAAREHRELSRFCRFGRVCSKGVLCEFAKYMWFGFAATTSLDRLCMPGVF